NVLSLDQIAVRLAARLRVLGGGSRTVLPRQQTLEATLDWSFLLLDEPEQVLFRRLAVFGGSFRLDSVEGVCGMADETLDLLARLVDKSLVQVEARPDQARYRLLNPIRDYAAAKLREAGDEASVRKAHRDWYVVVVQRTAAAWHEQQQADLLNALEVELDNVRSAMRTSIELDEAEP